MQVVESGPTDFVRGRWALRRRAGGTFDVALPAGADEVVCLVQGKGAGPKDGGPAGDGRLIRVPLPADDKPTLIDVRYRVPASTGMVKELALPRPRAVVAGIYVAVSLPGRPVPLAGSDAEVEETWGLAGGLPGPHPAFAVAEVERWLTTGVEPGEPASPWEFGDATLLARPGGPVRIVAVPRGAFVGGASGLAFALGLGLASAGRWRRALVPLTAIGVAAAALLAPQPAGQALAAALPGLALGLVALAAWRVRAWRHRRLVERLPAFRRIGTGSSLIPESLRRGVREGSTTDAAVNNPI